MERSGFDISTFLSPGDTVVIGQAVAEPPTLVELMIEASRSIEGITAFCGYTGGDAWLAAEAGRPRVRSYVAHGALRSLSGRGLLEVLPLHYSQIGRLFSLGRLPADVVMLQVGRAGENGHYDLGPSVDWAIEVAGRARVVLVEINENMPATNSAWRLDPSLVTASIRSTRPLAGSPTRPASEDERAVARQVAELIPSGATIQLGVGALAGAIAEELWSRRDLRFRTGLVGDWLVGLHQAGALADEPDACVTGIALGSDQLYKWLDGSAMVRFAQIQEQISPGALAGCDPFVSVNAAIEVDLLGQVNAEAVGDRYVGAIGGQVDFFRAARQAQSGRSIVALPSTGPNGSSRIVTYLQGPVTSTKSEYDLLVTEWGVADLAGATLPERARRIAAVAHPDHREALVASVPGWAQ